MKMQRTIILLTSLVIMFMAGTALADLNAGLVAHYSFNGDAGDASGNGNDGTVNGAILADDRLGNMNSAYSFDGADDYVDAGSLDVVGDELTLSLWFKSDSFSYRSVQDNRMISKTTGTSEQDHYWMLSSVKSNGTKLRFRLKTGDTTTALIASSGNLSVNTWTHVLAVYDGSFMRIYKDGIEVGSTEKSGPLSIDSTVPVWIGGNPPSATARPFDGIIDDVRIYNRALSASEIQEFYQGTNNELVAHYPFNGDAGDASGNGNDGTVNGAILADDRFGNMNSAYSFDGADDYVDAGSFDVVGNELTLSLWFKSDSFSYRSVQDNRMISKTTGTSEQDHYWMLSSINSNGTKLRFRLKTGGTTTALIASSGNLSVNTWTHALAVYDGSFMRIYKDGIEVGSTAKSGPLSIDSTVPVWIGGNPSNATARPFDGIIDDVRIYNYALSASEIQELSQGAAPGGGSGDGNSLDAADGDPIDAVFVDNEGNVGIGTTNPGIYKLAVNGKIKTKEVVVETTGWSDFVFKEHYSLMPLDQLEKYIKSNRHLPQIPSTDEVVQNGIGVGSMQSKLLQKIEELTLYMIKLEKKTEMFEKKNEILNNRLKALEKGKM